MYWHRQLFLSSMTKDNWNYIFFGTTLYSTLFFIIGIYQSNYVYPVYASFHALLILQTLSAGKLRQHFWQLYSVRVMLPDACHETRMQRLLTALASSFRHPLLNKVTLETISQIFLPVSNSSSESVNIAYRHGARHGLFRRRLSLRDNKMFLHSTSWIINFHEFCFNFSSNTEWLWEIDVPVEETGHISVQQVGDDGAWARSRHCRAEHHGQGVSRAGESDCHHDGHQHNTEGHHYLGTGDLNRHCGSEPRKMYVYVSCYCY